MLVSSLTRVAVFALIFGASSVAAAESPLVKSRQSGPWSAAATWDAGRPPAAGDRVVIRAGHTIAYDVDSKDVIRLIRIAGTLDFARDRSTRLEVGLIVVGPGEEPSEDGFDCEAHVKPPAPGSPRASLLVGTPDAPVSAKFTALIRLHYIEGMDKNSCPAIVCCGGRMDFHGAPLPRTWVKMNATASAGSSSVALAEAVDGWKEGDSVIVTSTRRPRGGFGRGETAFEDGCQTEERTIVAANGRGPGPSPGEARMLRLDAPLKFEHYAEGNYRAEVANLSRNVIVESADPNGIRGHTMYHRHSAGSISYAEFRHLGKKDTLGRYALHFHLCGDTMRGSFVLGASIRDSHNRWLTIHGTQYLLVRDCVGYKTIGHGFFLEDGTEVHNVLDRNLAACVIPGKPLPKQVLPFDSNKGAGYWWANCMNSFTNNVAVDCAEYGYKFECRKTPDFDPVLPILQPDGTVKRQDVRVLPFVRFENNEAHAMRFFGLNLRGITRGDDSLNPNGFVALNDMLKRDAAGAHPDNKHPFWVRNFRVWESNWSFHAGTSGVFLDGLDVFRAEYGLWRSVMDRHTYKNLSFREISNKDLHMPFSIGMPDSEDETGKDYFRGIPGFVDDMPPATIITSAIRDGSVVRIRGSASDTSAIKRVMVNNRAANSIRGSFSEWEIVLEAPAGKPIELSAFAEDVHGCVEPRPHKMRVE